MKVVIDGVEYTIEVSDDSDVVYVDTWQGLMDAVKNSENKNKTIALTDHIRAEGKDRILIKQDLTIDLKGFTVDRGRTKNDSDGHVFEIQNKSTVTITDSSATPSGTITGGYASRGGGIHVGSNCTCIVENITIRQNKAGADGGGVYVRGTLIMNNCTVSDNEAEETAGGIYCQDTGTIMLDNVEVTGNKAEGDGGGFKIHLKNSDSYIKDSSIYGNSSGEEGGGICLDGDSNTLTLNDTEISENYAEDEGGAIEIDSGTMKMNGGLIKGNKSADGGGVYNDSGKIDFDGVEISGNESISEGGAGINNKNDAMLKNCLIKENIGHDRGGGIWASDDITLESCTIEGNTSTGEGGGMYFKDIDATVRDCTIINNKTNASGGGIRIEDGKIFVINVTMTGNYAKENGGAVYTNNDAGVYFSGITSITENEAGKQGGGFMVGMHTSTAGIQDTVIIRDNTCGELGPNVHLGYINETSLIDSVGDFFDDFSIVETEYDYAQLKLTKKLSPDTCIYVTTQANFKNYSEDITVNYSKYHDGEDPTEYFITEPNYTVVRLSGEEELRLSTSMWPELQRLIDKTENKGTIELDRNWKAIKNNEALVIPEGKTITIDLAGYTIDRNCLNSDPDSAGYVFDVQGTLIVKDSSAGQTGKITGGNGKNGGGIYVRNTGSFTLESGNIVSNEAACGGAVYNEGKVQISGGNIKGNSVSNAGGAIYNAENASLTISGGELSGNDAKKAAGGVYLAEGSTFNVEGNAYVNGNSGSSGNNILIVDANDVIHVTGALSSKSKASLDFSVNITDPSQERKVTDGLNNTAVAAFSYNGKQYDTTESSVLKLGDDEELYIKGSNAPYDLLVSDWQQLYNALRNSENAGKIIGLANNIKAEGDDEELESTISNITLDLRGFTLDRNGEKGSVLNVVTNGVTFTVIDSVGSGLLTGGNANHGGGVYVKKGIFVMNGGTIANNKVNDDGAGVYCKESGCIQLNGVTIAHNTAGDWGGGVAIVDRKPDAEASSITDCIIENNTAEDGGGIYIDEHSINISGGYVRNNTAEEGGGIFVHEADPDRPVTIDGVKIQANRTTKDGGAGISNMGSKVTVTNCTVTENRSEESTGGGMWMSENSETTIEGSIFESNYAGQSGGGLRIMGRCILSNTTITGNTAGRESDGVSTDVDLYLKDKVIIFDNTDNQNVNLKGTAKLNFQYGALGEGSRIGVALEKNRGIFTQNFAGKHPDADPADYFYSDYGYVIKLKNNEAELGLLLEDSSDFIDLNSQINDISRLNGRNWMSGISGDRYLNEINIPCTHDSGMNSVRKHTMSSIGSMLGYTKNAKTQVRYIDEQFNDGVRRIDVRLTRLYEESDVEGLYIHEKDDGENLYINHGKDEIGGSYWAQDHNGKLLTLNKILDWAKAFLTEHPTEVLILDLQPEPPGLYVDDADEEEEETYKRARKIIEGMVDEINPSTGKPYIYWQNGQFKKFTSYPQLKDCRGQIIFNCGNNNVGGIDSFTMGGVSDDSPDGGVHGDTANHIVTTLKRFYSDPEKVQMIPKDVTRHLDVLYRSGALTAPLGLEGIPVSTPLEAAETIHNGLYYNGGIFDQTDADGNQKGQYVGWVRQDGVTAELNRMIWLSNFPADLNYVTVKVQPGTEDVSPKAPVQTYKLLKGTKIVIPGDIYGNDTELDQWDATAPSNSEKDGATSYKKGATYTVMTNVTFTANWGTEPASAAEEETQVGVIWFDSNSQDRPSGLTIAYNTQDGSGAIQLPEGSVWSKTIEGSISEITSVKDNNGKDIPVGSGASSVEGQNDQYYCNISYNKFSGYIIAMYLLSESQETSIQGIYGTIAWKGDAGEPDKRPSSTTVRLFDAVGNEIDNKVVGTGESGWNWSFNISDFGYTSTEGMSVAQDQIEGYETTVTAVSENVFTITNTLNGTPETSHVLEKVEAKAPTCTKEGNIEYWECTECGKCFSDEAGTTVVAINKLASKGGVILPATGHVWGEADYVWSEDNSVVTASAVCQNDSTHVIVETARSSSELIKEPTSSEKGERVYSAIFKGDNPFEEQTKKVIIPSTGEEEARETLGDLIDEAASKAEGDYTADSWKDANLGDTETEGSAIKAANDVFNDENSTTDQLNAAKDALQEALDKLVTTKEDAKSKLSTAISEAQKELDDNSEKYTEESATALQAVIDDATEVLNDTESTKRQFENAKSAVEAAVEALVTKADAKADQALKDAQVDAEDARKEADKAYADEFASADDKSAIETAKNALDQALAAADQLPADATADQKNKAAQAIEEAVTDLNAATETAEGNSAAAKAAKEAEAQLEAEKTDAIEKFEIYSEAKALPDATEDEKNAYEDVVASEIGKINEATDTAAVATAYTNAKKAVDEKIEEIKQARADAAEMAAADQAVAAAQLYAELVKNAAKKAAEDVYASNADKKAISDAMAAVDNALKVVNELPENATADDKMKAAADLVEAVEALDEAVDKAVVNSAAARAAARAAADEAADAAAQLAAAKTAACDRLDDYSEAKAKTDATAAEKAAYDKVVADGKEAINKAADKKAVEAALKEAKKAIDAALAKIDRDRAAAAADKYSDEWVNGKWYNQDGTQTYEGIGKWKKNSKGIWYEDSKGWYPKNRWQKIDGKWYFFDKQGYMEKDAYRKGWYLTGNGVWDGMNQVTGWIEGKKGWKYYIGTNTYLKDCWKKIDGKWYYFKADGNAAQHEFIHGWWLGDNCAWNDPVHYSWHRCGSRWWYGVRDGWYAKDKSYIIDGVECTFDKNGFLK